jgi:hypothetical protein
VVKLLRYIEQKCGLEDGEKIIYRKGREGAQSEE